MYGNQLTCFVPRIVRNHFHFHKFALPSSVIVFWLNNSGIWSAQLLHKLTVASTEATTIYLVWEGKGADVTVDTSDSFRSVSRKSKSAGFIRLFSTHIWKVRIPEVKVKGRGLSFPQFRQKKYFLFFVFFFCHSRKNNTNISLNKNILRWKVLRISAEHLVPRITFQLIIPLMPNFSHRRNSPFLTGLETTMLFAWLDQSSPEVPGILFLASIAACIYGSDHQIARNDEMHLV